MQRRGKNKAAKDKGKVDLAICYNMEVNEQPPEYEHQNRTANLCMLLLQK